MHLAINIISSSQPPNLIYVKYAPKGFCLLNSLKMMTMLQQDCIFQRFRVLGSNFTKRKCIFAECNESEILKEILQL